jgi:Arc/MetJ-type ribon-helix-helix transcriptional regulator
MTRDEDLVNTTVRLPEPLVEQLDEAVARSPDWLEVSRADLLRRLLDHGMERLNERDELVKRDALDTLIEGDDVDPRDRGGET